MGVWESFVFAHMQELCAHWRRLQLPEQPDCLNSFVLFRLLTTTDASDLTLHHPQVGLIALWARLPVRVEREGAALIPEAADAAAAAYFRVYTQQFGGEGAREALASIPQVRLFGLLLFQLPSTCA